MCASTRGGHGGCGQPGAAGDHEDPGMADSRLAPVRRQGHRHPAEPGEGELRGRRASRTRGGGGPRRGRPLEAPGVRQHDRRQRGLADRLAGHRHYPGVQNAQEHQGASVRQVTLGADVAVAAGPLGREAAAATDTALRAEIYSYSRSRGLFAGVSLDGVGVANQQRSQCDLLRRSHRLAGYCAAGSVDTGAAVGRPAVGRDPRITPRRRDFPP